MRTLNTNVKHNKQNTKFAMPGFRSGSIVKKFFALLYYCFAIYKIIDWVIFFSKGDFNGGMDIFAFVFVAVMIIAVFLVPVVVIGVSNYYDWHGIKQFMIIMVSICIISTVAVFTTNMFSKQYINSLMPPVTQSQEDGKAEDTIDSALDSALDSAIDSALDSASDMN